MSPIDRLKIRKMVLREMHEMGASQMDHAGRVIGYSSSHDEANMIKSNLYTIGSKALEMHDVIQDYDDLPEWVQEKIAVMDSMMSSVYDYLDYEYRKFNDPNMMPAAEPEYMAPSGALMEKKNGSVKSKKYHGQTYKATSALVKAIHAGKSYEELLKMADWAENPDAVVNAAFIVAKGKPKRSLDKGKKNEG